MKPIKESAIQKQILDYLHLKGYLAFKHRNVGIFKQNTGKYIPLAYGEKGIADIIGCTKNGIFFAIEVKVPTKKPSPDQKKFLEKVFKNNAVSILAYSLDDVSEIL